MVVVIPLAPGDYLTEAGYSVHIPAYERRTRLVQAVNKHSYKDIVSRLNATSIRLRNIAPVTYRKIRHDMKYLRGLYK